MTGPHNSESAFWSLASSGPDVPVGCRPNATSRFFISGDRAADTIAALSFATASGGVWAGA